MICPKCKTEFNSNFCPNCGNSANAVLRKPKNPTKVAIILICVAICCLLAMIPCIYLLPQSTNHNGTDNNSNSSQEYINVSPKELWNDFRENEIAAEAKYAGKELKITGEVYEINSSDALSSANVLLEIPNNRYCYVTCYFNSKNSQELINIKRGQIVTITGTYDNYMTLFVTIKDCKLQ